MNSYKLPASCNTILSLCQTGKTLHQITEQLDYTSGTVYSYISKLQRLGLMSKAAGKHGSIFFTLPEIERKESTEATRRVRNNGVELDAQLIELCKNGAQMHELVGRLKLTNAYIGRRLTDLQANGQVNKIKLAACYEWAYVTHGTELDPRYWNKDASLFVNREMIEPKKDEHERPEGANEDFIKMSHNIWRQAA